MAHHTRDPGAFSPLPEPARELPRPASTGSGPRLTLAPARGRRGLLNGGWWPRSRDAAPELTGLAATLGAALGTVTGLIVAREDWDRIPRRIVVGGEVIKVGWLPDLGNMIIVTRHAGDDVALLVVPADAPERAALTALAGAASATPGARPREILAACDISTAPPSDRGRDVPPSGRPALRLLPTVPDED